MNQRPLAVLGGAFDPVTIGHLATKAFVESLGFRVLLMPCGNRHGFEKKMQPAETRVRLLELTVPKDEICHTEIRYGSFRASDTYPRLIKEFGPVHWIIGSDNANCMHQWFDGENLKKLIPFLVIERPAQPLEPNGHWCLSPPHRFFAAKSLPKVSSTLARTAIANEDWPLASSVLPGKVLNAIRLQGLYRRFAA